MRNELPRRKPIRLPHYDYSQPGLYFITICTKNRQNLFWKPLVGAVCGRLPLSKLGKIVECEIHKLSIVNKNITIPNYVIMPNHIHLMISVADCNGRPQTAPTVSWVVNLFKGSVSKQAGYTIWQKSFYDHVIRSEASYLRIWQYIDENPLKWHEDCYFSDN